ncbi:9134_t:CDS:2, partial [Cetraspora pellucida]
MPYLPNSKPSKSNNQGDKNWTSNIEQEEKPVGKGKQKATSSTSENNKVKNNKTHAIANTENNKQTDTEHMHITHDKIDTQDKIVDSTTSDDTSNSAEVNQDMNTQTSCSTDNTSFNWANITEKELQDSEIWEDILLEQTKARTTTTEETNNTCQNNNVSADKHVFNQNSQSEDNNQ